MTAKAARASTRVTVRGGPGTDPLVHERASSGRYALGPVPALSVVIATHGRAEFLKPLLACLEGQTLEQDAFEVILVDDHSPDDSWAVLRQCASTSDLRLLCLHLAENVGSGTARTVGLGQCRAPVVAFTDDDCLPTPQWLAALTAPFSAGPVSPAPIVVQGRTLPWPGDEVTAGPWARTVWVLGPTWLFETCNVAYRRCDLETVGGFPSRAETPPVPSGRQVGEDALVGWEVLDLGGTLVFEAGALVHHRNVAATFRDWLRDQRGREVFPALAARNPRARQAFWGHWFLSRRSAAAVVASLSVGAFLLTRRARWSVGALPWVVLAAPEARSRPGRNIVLRLAQLALVDLTGLAATARGSIRHRVLVL